METMKKTFIFLLLLAPVFVFVACEDDDEPVFKASVNSSVSFVNAFSANYVISEPTANNVAERFVWGTPDFGAPVNINYELYGAPAGSTDYEVVGVTTTNDLTVAVGDLLEFATDLGLDGDPETTNADGTPNNTGAALFFVRAYAGSDSPDVLETFSDTVALSFSWAEVGGGVNIDEDPFIGYIPQLFAVGAGTSAGWSWDTPEVIPLTSPGVYSGTIGLDASGDSNFRFFTEETVWATGLNYPFFVDEGYDIDDRFSDNEDGDNNFRTSVSGTFIITINTADKTIILE